MFLHYLKIAFRNLWKYKMQSAIGIIGLAVGFVCITMAAIWIRYEMTYESSHPGVRNIYRIIHVGEEDPENYDEVLPAPLAGRLQQTLPGVGATAIVRFWCQDRLCFNNRLLEGCYNIDEGFFDVFSVQFVAGDRKTVFIDQYTVTITEKTAKELFGSAEQAMGKILKSKKYSGDDGPEYLITGVVKDFEHSNLRFKALQKFTPSRDDNWYNSSFAIFIRIANNIDKTDLYCKLKNITITELDESNFRAIPINQMQYRYTTNEQIHVLPFIYIITLGGISLLLFICALFNHLSLFTSLMLVRVRELGLREVLGAGMKQLLALLVTEVVFTILLSFVLGFCLIEALRPAMEHATSINIGQGQVFEVAGVIALSGIVISLAVALYPIWRVCRIAIQQGMTGKNLAGRKLMQKALMALQLVIGIFFLFVTSVMYGQLHYTQTKDLGFDRTNVLRVEPESLNQKEFSENVDAICHELCQNTAIEDVLKQNIDFFAVDGAMSTGIDWDDMDKESRVPIARIDANANFAGFFHIPVKEGRFYSMDLPDDADKLVINEKLADMIGRPVVGKVVKFFGRQREIIGVVANINDRSLRHDLIPTGITLSNGARFLYIRHIPGKESEALKYMATVFEKHGISGYTSQSMDDIFDEFSKTETIMMSFIGIVTIMCFIISVSGIYSVTLYSMERRRREIAIRKVVGADVSDMISMFIKEYLWLGLIACIIAIPFAWYVINKWLQGYANHIGIAWWLALCIVVAVLSIVVVTILKQIFKAANENPAEVVKSE